MKKTLLAAALGVGFVSAAQAETSVTLYGVLDVGVSYQRVKLGSNDIGGSGTQSRFGLSDGVQNGSRWGLRGTEDLGNGLRALFTLEGGFDTRNGTAQQGGRLFGRQATLGLAGDSWGQVEAGRQQNVASTYFANIDPFGLDYYQANAGTAFSAANSVRYDNSVLYQTPSMGGFQAAIGYSFAFDDVNRPGQFETKENSRAVTAGLRYANGPLELVLTYDQQFLKPNQPQPKQAILGGSYDFEVAKLALAYGYTKDGVFAAQDFERAGGFANPHNSSTRGYGATNGDFTWKKFKIHSYLVGVSAPLGAGSVFGSWQRADPNKKLEAMDVFSVGYTYDLSRRTNLYAYASYADGAAFVDGNKSTVTGVGLRHRF